VVGGDLVSERDQLFATKFDQFPAPCTVQVVVLGIAVVQFVDHPAVKLEAVQQARVDELSKCPIDRGGTDVVLFSLAGEFIDQFVRVEVLVLSKDRLHQKLPRLGLPLTLALQILLKAFLW